MPRSAAPLTLSVRMRDMNTNVMSKIVDRSLSGFPSLIDAANGLPSPNPEDTFLVKCAIVGFSQYSATENWTKSELEYVLRQLADGADGLAENELRLKALCLGALCGLWHEKKLTDEEFGLAEVHLPGLIMLHAGKV